MRPINKGDCPQINGIDKKVTNYQSWRKDLIERIGEYCVYCNMTLSHGLQVEHVIPKTPMLGQLAGSLLAWNNVLIACGPCNNAKDNKPSDKHIHYLPEYHNGLLPFIATTPSPFHPEALVIDVNSNLTATQKMKAQTTIKDFGWQNIDTRGKIVDIRWLRRYKAKQEVIAAREILDIAKKSPTYDEDKAGSLVARQASGAGFFILWFHEFANEPAVLKWLIHPDLFPGVAQDSFDSSTHNPIPRNPQNYADPI